MPSLKRELYDTFQSLINTRDQLRLELAQAQETISLLETEVNAIKFHGDAAFTKIAEQMEVAKHTFELVTDSIPESHWVKDIWLAEPSSAALLGEAESAWKENTTNPQKALNIVGIVLKGTLEKSERMKCTLFMAAVMLAAGKTEEACASANEVLQQCGNDFKYKHLAGIAHYLRGRVFFEIQTFRQAYWDFSLVVFIPGYHERAKHFQRHAEHGLLQEYNRQQSSKKVTHGSNVQIPMDSTSNQRRMLKLAPGVQQPTDELKFEKATTLPSSMHKDL